MNMQRFLVGSCRGWPLVAGLTIIAAFCGCATPSFMTTTQNSLVTTNTVTGASSALAPSPQSTNLPLAVTTAPGDDQAPAKASWLTTATRDIKKGLAKDKDGGAGDTTVPTAGRTLTPAPSTAIAGASGQGAPVVRVTVYRSWSLLTINPRVHVQLGGSYMAPIVDVDNNLQPGSVQQHGTSANPATSAGTDISLPVK